MQTGVNFATARALCLALGLFSHAMAFTALEKQLEEFWMCQHWPTKLLQ